MSWLKRLQVIDLKVTQAGAIKYGIFRYALLSPGQRYVDSLIETARANDIEPYDYLLHILKYIGAADTPEKLEALLP
ncbi:MAG: transposase domain-containing protein [Candidatus Thiodiazotropha sp.]|jgi:hypothetical protein